MQKINFVTGRAVLEITHATNNLQYCLTTDLMKKYNTIHITSVCALIGFLFIYVPLPTFVYGILNIRKRYTNNER